MMHNLLNLAAIAFYLITWVMITKSIKAESKTPENKSHLSKFVFITWGFALAAHIFSIHTPLSSANTLAFNFMTLGSYVMWFLSLILFVTTISRKIQALAIAILPITTISIILLLIDDHDSDKFINMKSGLGAHIIISLLAYSTLMLSAFQAALLAAQNNHLHQRLKNPQKMSFLRTLPALEDMEYFLFRLIGIGLILLSLSLLSGFYYLENLFGSSVAHKTILSILSWIIFGALLLGRWKYGWRGKTAVRWTIAGFMVLALAFFGSKFIQEYILKETAYNNKEEPYTISNKGHPPTFLMNFKRTNA